jgi:hypothetical protein
MDKVDSIFKELNGKTSFDDVRLEIADLIKGFLNDKDDGIDNWEYECISNAIGFLKSNIARNQADSDFGLRPCLVCINNAYTHKEDRNEEYVSNSNEISSINVSNLKKEINSIA